MTDVPIPDQPKQKILAIAAAFFRQDHAAYEVLAQDWPNTAVLAAGALALCQELFHELAEARGTTWEAELQRMARESAMGDDE